MNNRVPTKPDADRVSILGVQIDAIGINAAITHLISFATATDSRAVYVVKPYVEFLDRASRDDSLRQLLNNAYMSLPDGVAAIWAAHYLYAGPHSVVRFFKSLAQIVISPNELTWPLPERIAGINFTWPLLEAAAQAGTKVFLIGQMSDEDIGRTAHTLRARIPRLNIVGIRNGRDDAAAPGHVTEAWIDETALRLSECGADLVLVGMGFPLQERIIAKLAAKLDHGVLIGEGGTFDYEAFGGSRPKAPIRVQRLGLEWLWRLLQEPGRAKRQLAVPRFILGVWKAR